MYKTPVNVKYCGTCSYWCGNATLAQISLVECSGSGKCANKNGFFQLSMNWQAQCPRWEQRFK